MYAAFLPSSYFSLLPTLGILSPNLSVCLSAFSFTSCSLMRPVRSHSASPATAFEQQKVCSSYGAPLPTRLPSHRARPFTRVVSTPKFRFCVLVFPDYALVGLNSFSFSFQNFPHPLLGFRLSRAHYLRAGDSVATRRPSPVEREFISPPRPVSEFNLACLPLGDAHGTAKRSTARPKEQAGRQASVNVAR